MLAPLRVAEISPAWKARLLLVSSQASPPSSQHSFQKACMNLTDSTAPALLITTFLPVLSVSPPPKAESIVYVKVGASPKVCPSVWPYGLPFFLRMAKSLRVSSQVLGYSLAPASFSKDFR